MQAELRNAPGRRPLANAREDARVRIGVISDTHLPRGSRRIPDGCLERLRESDLIVHAGDISEPEVLGELEGLGRPVYAVRGNVDVPALRQRLPGQLELDVSGARLAVVHD